MSCEKNDTESTSSSYSYLDEPDFVKDGLVGYYPFNGDVKDYSGNENDAIGTGLTFAVDRFNYSDGAVHFNGLSDFLIIPDFGNSLENNEGTIIMWCKIDTSQVTNSQQKSVVFSVVDSVNTCFLLGSMMGILDYSFGNYPGLGSGTIRPKINKEDFMLCVISFTNNSFKIYDYANNTYYTDAISHKDYSFGFNEDRKEQNLYLGKSVIDTFESETFDNFFTYFKGDIDDLLIYNRILTDDEIKYFLISNAISD
jgi:hypothetical protein